MADTEKPARTVAHPLEPLSAEEISVVAELLRADGNFGDSHRFASVVLHEPPVTNDRCGPVG
jgi:primary-amine oxidase